jgi:hypothetical protein
MLSLEMRSILAIAARLLSGESADDDDIPTPAASVRTIAAGQWRIMVEPPRPFAGTIEGGLRAPENQAHSILRAAGAGRFDNLLSPQRQGFPLEVIERGLGGRLLRRFLRRPFRLRREERSYP